MILAREELENLEDKSLKNYAVKSGASKGRAHSEDKSVHRMAFQKDRDRIIHCKSFRRLEAKTQVFLAHSDDHYRNRLTHTLEVAQISRDIARNLGVNEDLVEAIALAHDLGHTPFGHAGEETLNEIMKEYGMYFEHNQQSQRVVEKLEKLYPEFDGLNLSLEVREGLMKHETPYDKQQDSSEKAPHAPSIEAQIVNLSDEIAYTNHDIDDGLRSGLIHLEQLEEVLLWKENIGAVYKKYGKELPKNVYKSRCISNLISMMIADLLQETVSRLKAEGIRSLEDVYAAEIKLVGFSKEFAQKNNVLKEFLYKKLYFHPEVKKENANGQKILRALFEKFKESPEHLPARSQQALEQGDKLEEVLKDHVAGMTDAYATRKFEELC